MWTKRISDRFLLIIFPTIHRLFIKEPRTKDSLHCPGFIWLYKSKLSTRNISIICTYIFGWTLFIVYEGKVQKKQGKKLTSVSFAFTHTYTPVKTNIFRFFPQAYIENFEKCAKTQKQKKQYIVPCFLWLLVFPSLFWTFP